jgi:formylglycine-generating enzyme required for sulfatase activity/dienelactone hydrolase/predicted Ser/Thr protein kinase
MQGTISHYRIEGELGQGGMGVVYRAVDTKLGRPVAIKMLPGRAADDAERYQRFVREAQAASALNHPNIVTIYEIGEAEGRTFIAMELVDGRTLKDLLSERPAAIPIPEALQIAEGIAAALATAHANGIVHRDIKPANVVVTSDGRAKVLDFGLAKVTPRNADDPTITGMTRPGTVLGTVAYMSPEQAEGKSVDARTDIFSLGAVLYEMLTGRRPFAGSSDAALVSAILKDDPPPLATLRPDVSPALIAVITRALAKDPNARQADGAALRTELAAIEATLRRPPAPAWRRPAVAVPIALVLLALAAFGGWQTVQARRLETVRQRDIPEIERLQFTDHSLRAVRIAGDAERVAPREIARVREAWFPFDTTTTPEGAEVSIRNYVDTEGPWQPIGSTPVRGVFLPQGLYQIRVTKPGYVPVELSYSAGMPPIPLTPEAAAEPGMVFVPGGPFSIGVADSVTLPDFWIDRLEVTNREFKAFVDAGGYRDPAYWQEPFRDGNRVVAFEQAMARFRDATDRPGPATWELGTYAEGTGDYPVGGISWYEAAAYAVFAKKSLPTIYHWYRASGVDLVFSDMLRLSQFDAKGPAKVGSRRGIGPFGAVDMAGNIKEWCRNEAGTTGLRYILGGGWNEPVYRFRESEARDAWRRDATFGVRLMKSLPAEAAVRPVTHVYGDPKTLVPVPDDQFALLRAFYNYDRTPLNATVDARDDSSEHWIKERVTFDAAYGGERVPAYLFLPKNGKPPFQTVILFPSSYAREVPSSELLDVASFDFIVRSGRALLYPVYYATFERRRPEAPGVGAARDRNVNWAKDLFRAVDYLETRPELDTSRLAYYSLSLGAFFGPIPVSLEPRIKAAVFAAGGLRFTTQPEMQTANFMPRVTVPVLLINGKDDFAVPPEARARFLELLGTPPDRKRAVALDGGHVPSDMRGFYREVLNWFDTHLGPVR